MLRCIINYYTFVLSMVLSSAAVRQKLSHGLRCRCRTYFHCSTSLRSAIRRPAKTSVTSHCIATSCVSYRRTNYRPERSLISFFTSTGRSSQPSTLKAGLYIYYCHDRAYPFKAYCCRMGTATIKHPVSDDWASECPDVKNYKWRLNPVWHRMLYNCTHTATVGFKGISTVMTIIYI